MFNWDSCPIDLFDLYIEVGEVKKSKTEYDGCVCIELWIKSTFSNTCVREECKNPIRRPVFGVLKQIRKLCDDKPVCLMIMGDDNSNAVMHWGSVIALLLKNLKKENILKHSVLYINESKEEFENYGNNIKWRKEKEKSDFLSLPNLTDEIVYGQANCHLK